MSGTGRPGDRERKEENRDGRRERDGDPKERDTLMTCHGH